MRAFELAAGEALSLHVIDEELADGCLFVYVWPQAGAVSAVGAPTDADASIEAVIRSCWEAAFAETELPVPPFSTVELWEYDVSNRVTGWAWDQLPADLFADFRVRFSRETGLWLTDHVMATNHMEGTESDELQVLVSDRDYWLRYEAVCDTGNDRVHEEFLRRLTATANACLGESTAALGYPELHLSAIRLYDDGSYDLFRLH